MLTPTVQIIDEVDLNSDGEFAELDVGPFEYVTIEVDLVSGSWGAAILAIQDTVSGINWRTDATLDTFTSTVRVVAQVNVKGRSKLRVTLTTKAGAAATARVLCVGKVES